MNHLTPTKIISALLLALVLSGCDSDSSGPAAAKLSLKLDDIKTFHFSWPAVAGATHYQLHEDPDGKKGTAKWTMLAELPADTHEYRLKVPLYARADAQYLLSSCNADDCTPGQVVMIDGNPELNHLVKNIGYLKASNTGTGDRFGYAVSLNQDGTVLAVGAPYENGANDTKSSSGAVYLFSQDAQGNWQAPQHIRATDATGNALFGWSVSLNDAGDVLAVGAPGKNNNNGAAYVFSPNSEGDWEEQTVVPGDEEDYGQFGRSVSLNKDGTVLAVGADGLSVTVTDTGIGYAFIFVPDDDTPDLTDWKQQARLSASNAERYDAFGVSVSLNDAGTLVAVSAPWEDSLVTGVLVGSDNQPIADGDVDNNGGATDTGAVYLFGKEVDPNDPIITWPQQAYIKASNTGRADYFGTSVSLNGDGRVLAVGAKYESSSAQGAHFSKPTTDDDDNNALSSGAVYLFSPQGDTWEQQAYIKASNTGEYDGFGTSVSLSADGQRLAVGATGERSNAIGLNGNDKDDTGSNNGAAYSYVVKPGGTWQFESYLKASNAEEYDAFGAALSLSGDGQTLAVGAPYEDSNGQSVGGLGGDNLPDDYDPLTDNNMEDSGAVYLY
ncbi:FG-GAP repeat protein [Saccharospirillum sp. HFRX-1]|uniref:FG-GAP repeat protein n=1 Tax=unclassified Saccharospirillum TaxID=2633430 RepID=UPI0037232B2B